jgi:chromosomal replication initiation ATPase DnaA
MKRSRVTSGNRGDRDEHVKSVQAIVDDLRLHELFDLVKKVRRRRGVTLHELCGRARSQNVAAARHELWWHIRHHPERSYSLVEIARLFGRDHTTVSAGLLAHQRRRQALDTGTIEQLAQPPPEQTR